MVTVNEVLSYLEKNGEEFAFSGDESSSIEGFSSLMNYRENTITWCKTASKMEEVNVPDTDFSLVVTCKSDIDGYKNCSNVIMVQDPKRIFFSIIEAFFDNSSTLPDIGNNTYISDDVIIGKNVKIGYNCVIDGSIEIGDDTVIYNNVNMINKVRIGRNCVIHSGVNIGHDDFSYTEDENHNKKMIKHYGGVEIGDDVFIGAGSAVNRGTIDDTRIGNGCKIDAFCHISHNVILGEKSALISGTRLYGSVKTGVNVYIASAIVKNQISLGDNTVVGMGSVVLNNIDDDTTVAGIPAKPLKK